MDTSKLWVISVISNPVRYKSRYALYRRFAERMKKSGVNHMTVEMAFGDRPFEVTERYNPRHLQLRSFEELWHKENMINLGVQRLSHLDPNWEYVAWVDADICFQRDDWAEETVHQLQHHHIVQMWQHGIDLGPDGETLQVHNGFVYNYLRGCFDVKPNQYNPNGYIGHPGYAWACRRESFDFIGGLIDIAILGASDYNMAQAFLGRIHLSYPRKVHRDYKDYMENWQSNCERYIKRDIGYVKGTVFHEWHGKKKNRFYVPRERILVDNQFSPYRDLRRDAHGLWQISDSANIELRDQIRAYFRSRMEDSIDCE